MVWMIFILILIAAVSGLPEEPDLTYDKLYQFGKQAYTDERWYECVAFMRRSLEDYKYYRETVEYCRKRCDRNCPVDPFDFSTFSLVGGHENLPEMFAESTQRRLAIPERKFWERLVKHSLCLVRCRHDRFSIRPQIETSKQIEEDFDSLKPYNYMQLCYWKLEDLPHAVSAAYTYLLRNSGDKMMIENLEFYRTQKDFTDSMLKDMEQPEYEKLYNEGAIAYDNQQFLQVVDKIERALEGYTAAENDCRIGCESTSGITQGLSATVLDRSNMSTMPEFYVSVADKFISVLRCKQNCAKKLSVVKGQFLQDYYASHFHYLQFGYWKVQQVRKACEAVASYLLFFPEDDSMLHNKGFYKENFPVTEKDFKPRREALEYYQRQLREARLLGFVDERFAYENDDYASERVDDYRDINDQLGDMPDLELELNPKVEVVGPPVLPATEPELKESTNIYPPGSIPNVNEIYGPHWRPSKETLLQLEKEVGVKVTQKEADLNGQFRFVAENLLTDSECKSLMELITTYATPGNGYDGQSSPHTKFENFQGLRANEAVDLAIKGLVKASLAKLYFDRSELARHVIENYFNLSSHLYFDYTHLVCRSAKNGYEGLRNDMSHPIHGDNCVLKNGKCEKKPPAYTWRDYSALIYLNADFEGGEFLFTDADKNVQSELKPQCGRMVAFVGETPHGVKAVTKGLRCVLAQWMTLDPKHEEVDRLKAQQKLAELELMDDAETIEVPAET